MNTYAVFLTIAKFPFGRAITIHILTSDVWECPFLHSFTNKVYGHIFKFLPLIGIILICIYLIMSEFELFSIYFRPLLGLIFFVSCLFISDSIFISGFCNFVLKFFVLFWNLNSHNHCLWPRWTLIFMTDLSMGFLVASMSTRAPKLFRFT